MNSAFDILSFLAKAWSEDNRTKIYFNSSGKQAYCSTQDRRIEMPDYFGSAFPGLEGLSRWRIWRFLTFHESMHLKHSPEDFDSIIKSIFLKTGLIHIPRNFIKQIANIIEDYRIEKLGMRVYRGISNEKGFCKAMLLREVEPPPDMANSRHALMAFMLALYFGVLPDPSFEYHDLVMECLNASIGVETVSDLIDASAKVALLFDSKFKFFYLNNLSFEEFLAEKLGNGIPEMPGSTVDAPAPEGVLREFEVVSEEARSRSELRDYISELMDLKGGYGELNIISRPILQNIMPNFALLDEAKLITDRIYYLVRLLRTEWLDYLSEIGDDIDVEEFLLSRDSGLFFIDEDSLSNKDPLAILFDMSRSIESIYSPYMKSIIAITNAFDMAGIPFGLYAFRVPSFLIFKAMGEKWSSNQATVLSAQQCFGGTPIHDALRILKKLNGASESFKRVVVITDGYPQDVDATISAVNSLESSGIKVYFLGIRRLIQLKPPYNDLFKASGMRSGRISIAYSLHEVPEALFRLLVGLEG